MLDLDVTKITVQSYNDSIEAYANKTILIDTTPQINIFSSYLKKGDLILDSGCGPGRDAKIFTNLGYRIKGIDLSTKMLEYAKEYAPKAEYELMSLDNLDFPDNTFDGVWAMSSLMHLKKADFPFALSEHYRVLKNGGPFYLSLKRGVGEGLEPDARYNGIMKFYAYYSDDDVLKILDNTKFKILDFKTSATGDFKYANAPWMDIYLQK